MPVGRADRGPVLLMGRPGVGAVQRPTLVIGWDAGLVVESTRARRGGLVRARDFRRLWAAQSVSAIGSEARVVAVLLVAIFTLPATTLEVGALSAAETAAFLLAGLPAGVLVDRLSRRPVMVAADGGGRC